MSALTRFVLSHKRIVAITWLVLTIAGIAAAGPASRALDPEFSVPGGAGWETNGAIAQRRRGPGRNSAPLMPVVTLPEGKRPTAPACEANWLPWTAASSAPCRARGVP